MTRARRETAGDLAVLAAAGLLIVSLFLVWSHQLPAPLLARYGPTGTFAGVPRDPDAWQVYSTMDVALTLVAVAFVAVALRGGRTARRAVAGGAAVALAFVVRAELAPPTNGVTVFDAGAYAHVGASPGAGEALALVALGLGLAGLAFSFSADR